MAGRPWKQIKCQFCGTTDNLEVRDNGRPRNVCKTHSPLLQQIYRDRLRERAGLPPLQRVNDRITEFEVGELPPRLRPVETLLDEREAKFKQLQLAEEARRLIPIKVAIDGPIGLAIIGDPHVDDNGTNLARLRGDMRAINDTPGMFGVPVGDISNNWMGRLVRLWGSQSTDQEESMQLVEWFIGGVRWLFIVGGNHDVWSGAQDPIPWLVRSFGGGVYEWHGVRAELQFPNGRKLTSHVNHNWPGFSMWNPGHGVGRAIQTGIDDHIVAGGHKHTCAYMTIPARLNGRLCHGLQIGSYKQIDDYAKAGGLNTAGNFAPSAAFVIDPSATDETRFIKHYWNVEEAAEVLTFQRTKRGRSTSRTAHSARKGGKQNGKSKRGRNGGVRRAAGDRR